MENFLKDKLSELVIELIAILMDWFWAKAEKEQKKASRKIRIR